MSYLMSALTRYGLYEAALKTSIHNPELGISLVQELDHLWGWHRSLQAGKENVGPNSSLYRDLERLRCTDPDTLRRNPVEFANRTTLRRHVITPEGEISLQASEFHTCYPRTDALTYTHVELGFHKDRVRATSLMLKDSDVMEDSPVVTNVRSFVPADEVIEIISELGGVIAGAPPPLRDLTYPDASESDIISWVRSVLGKDEIDEFDVHLLGDAASKSAQVAEYVLSHLYTREESRLRKYIVINEDYGGFEIRGDVRKTYECLIGAEMPEGVLPERHDPALVKVVDQLGDKAWPLVLAKVEGGKYFLSDYDGLETVHTPENIDWNVIP